MEKNESRKTAYTPEQEAAICHRGSSLLVSSAAGSGKTMVLVERLLKYIEDGHNIDEFLVITYTRAAAAELRERIHNKLQNRLAAEPSNVHLRRQSMLCRGANIDTIHTFCGNLLRENAHIAGLPPDFRIADENECGIIKNEVLDEVFVRTYNRVNEDLGVLRLLEMYVDGRSDNKLAQIVTDIHTKLMSVPDPSSWVDSQIEKLQNKNIIDISQTDVGGYLMNSLKSRTEHCIRIMLDITREMAVHPEVEDKYGANINAVLSGCQRLYDALCSSWDESVEHAIFDAPGVKSLKGFDELKAQRDWCREELKKIAKLLDKCSADHILDMEKLAPAVKTLYELVLEFDRAYCEEKRKRGIVDFSDIEHLTLSLLHDKVSKRKTKIAEAISKRFTEILVDEYQDVNEVQEMLFKSLSKDENNIFMVGDVKQSIYSFRLAEPAIFLNKYRDFEDYRLCRDEGTQDEKAGKTASEKTKTAQNRPVKIFLSKNFRSQPKILEAANHIFRKIMSEELGEINYTDDEALIPGREDNFEKHGKKGIPYIYNQEQATIEGSGAFQGRDVAVEYDLISTVSDEPVDDEEVSSTQLEALHVAVRIKDLLESGYEIEEKDGSMRKIQPGDIAILSRTIKGKSWRFAAELSKIGIESDISGSEDYFETVEIQTILSLLSVIDNPIQDIAFASVLSGIIYGLTSDEMSQIRLNNKDVNYYEAIKRSAEHEKETLEISCKCREILNEIDELRELAYDMPSDRFIWSVYNRTGILKKVLAMKNGTQRRKNLLTFVESAQEYEKSGFKGLFSFLRFMQGLQERGIDISKGKDEAQAGKGQAGSVKILSIHKSKGLEFPVVFLVDTAKQHNKMDLDKHVVFHKNFGVGSQITDTEKRIRYTTLGRTAIREKLKEELLSEELRILYVALTRAKEKLFITAASKNCEKKYNELKMLGGAMGEYPPQALMSMGSMAEWLMAGTMGIDESIVKINWFGRASIGESIARYGRKNEQDIQETEQVQQEEAHEQSQKQQEQAQGLNYEQEAAAGEALALPDIDASILEYEYPFEAAVSLPSKLTVTALKSIIRQSSNYGEESASADDSEMAPWVEAEQSAEPAGLPEKTQDKKHSGSTARAKKPQFLSEKKELSGASRGTLIHEIMRYIDYKSCSNDSELKDNIKKLVISRHLSDEANEIGKDDINRIIELLNSDLGERIKRTSELVREFRYSLLSLSENYFENSLGSDDEILVQGIIDCFFEEDGKYVIVDFKTDKVNEHNIEERIKIYTPQLAAYSEALERITKKEVKERIIYFFETGAAVSV